MRKDTVFWDVDTQFDFMRPEGRLYVPGAETIIDTVSEVRRFALGKGYSIIADIDWHSEDNKEISENPDFERTFPPHCMAGEPGSERVGYLGELPIEYVPIEKLDAEDLRQLVAKDQFHVVIKKDELDVFSNPNTRELVKLIEPTKVIVFGVALDFCVSCVVQELGRFGGIELCVLTDAVKGLGVKPEPEIFDEFRRMGVRVAEFGELRGNL
jgi:nicotinamidase/pyrazinamidase